MHIDVRPIFNRRAKLIDEEIANRQRLNAGRPGHLKLTVNRTKPCPARYGRSRRTIKLWATCGKLVNKLAGPDPHVEPAPISL